MPTFTIDGKQITCPAGTSVLRAAWDHGIDIPYYCWHPKLSVAGVCRMCVVEIKGMPKLQIACNTLAQDGMEVNTNSEKVKTSRKGNMEILLINHPLDCPICDQSGECKLQDYSFAHGAALSRMKFPRRFVHPVRNLGDMIVMNMNRCIHCLLCVRFCGEVAGTEEMGAYQRGHDKDIGTYLAENALHNDYQGNLADICPVGALTSKEFRFHARVWNLKSHESICPRCSTGCNILLDVKDDKVLRVRPRFNDAVNDTWICDVGRRVNHWVHDDESRLVSPWVRAGDELDEADWRQALVGLSRELREIVAEHGPQAVGFIGSSYCTNEANYLFRRLAREVVGSPHLGLADSYPGAGEVETWDGVLQRRDTSPNLWGAREIVQPGDGGLGAREMIRAAAEGKFGALFVMGADLLKLLPEEDVAGAADGVDLFVVQEVQWTETARMADYVLPAATFAEMDGTYVNYYGRVQRFAQAVSAPGLARPDWQIVADIAAALGGSLTYHSASEIFDEIAREIPVFHGLSLGGIGPLGVTLPNAVEPVGPPAPPPLA